MDRRGAAGALFATILAGGFAALIGATAVPHASPHFDTLLYGGLAAIAVGGTGLLWLLISAKPAPAPAPAITQQVRSHRQSGGVTAFNYTSREPDPAPQRSVSDEQIRAMTSVLRRKGLRGKLLLLQFKSREQASYIHQIGAAFVAAGWEKETLLLGDRPHRPEMLRITAATIDHPHLAAAAEALQAAGIEFQAATHETNAMCDVAIEVGVLVMTVFQEAADRPY